MHGEMQIRIILHPFFNNQFIKKSLWGYDWPGLTDFKRKRHIQFYGNKQFQLNRVPKGGSLEPWSPKISVVEPGALIFY